MSAEIEKKGRALSYAIESKENEVVIELLNEIGFNFEMDGYPAPLHQALIYENWEIARYCLEGGANVNIANTSFDTPLMTCCKHGNLDMIRLLVERGAEINAQNKYDATPISLAIADHSDDLELIEYLLQNGADPMIYEKYGESDPRITTYTAYDFAKYDLEDDDLVELLDKFKK